MVCIYEFLGTAFLSYAVLMSYGNAIAISIGLYGSIIILGPITGAHMNPAVSFGVFFWQKKFGEDIILLLMIVVS